VWWEPAAYANPHVAVSGETGSGKTQSLMALASELHRQQVPLLILDFKDDYAQSFATTEGVAVWDPAEARLPFNPLAPVADAEGRVEPLAHVHRVADVVKRVWGLGDQQAHRLREALKQLYASAGVALEPHLAVPGQRWPAFGELTGRLEERDTLRGRLSPVFDLGLLDPGPQAEVGFARLVEAGGIVRLARLPGDEAKSAVAELLLLALYGELVRRPHTRRLRLGLLLDEGWRLSACPYLEPLLREGRAFGLAAILASQFPRDLPPAVRGSCATQLFFAQTDAAQAAEVAKAVLGETHSAQAVLLSREVRSLSLFTALLHRRDTVLSRRPWTVVRVLPWFERRGLGAGADAPVARLTPRAFNPGLEG
ncbi:MAG TPA: helicase HerA-like domain-containing protein, partial [Candidatus Dormibacteraeota bacterium]|nr:helicase HerA-like domain-containing protein [Candidatus Dormibacteraeota bacterium]